MNRRFFVTGGTALAATTAVMGLAGIFRSAENSPAAADIFSTNKATASPPKQACILSIEPNYNIEELIAGVRRALDNILVDNTHMDFTGYVEKIEESYIKLFGENSVELADEFGHALDFLEYEESKYSNNRDALQLYPDDGTVSLKNFTLEQQKFICDATTSFGNLVIGTFPTLAAHRGLTGAVEKAMEQIGIFSQALEQNIGASCGAPSYQDKKKPAAPVNIVQAIRYA